MLVGLVSCKGNDGAPSGMKLASDRSLVDYSLYVPEMWSIDEAGTFTRTHSTNEAVSVSVFTFPVAEDTAISEWWSSYYRPTLEQTSDSFALVEDAAETSVDAKGAFSYVYTLNSYITNGEELVAVPNKSKVIIVKNNCKMYVIRYNAMIIDDQDYYSSELDNFDEILGAFKFSALEAPKEQDALKDKNPPEGMKIASNKKIVLYSLYVPESWIIDESGAMTLAHVSNENKSSVSVMQWSQSSDIKTIDSWWENVHKKELAQSFESFTVIEEGVAMTLDEREAKAYTYTVTISGKVYKYFVVAVIDQGSLHIITYTSTPELYDETFTVVKEQILPNFKMK